MASKRILKSNGFIKQWGTVSNTSGSSSWIVQNLNITYSNTNYKIFLQGRYDGSISSYPVIKPSDVTTSSFNYYWGSNTNLLDYFTIGY